MVIDFKHLNPVTISDAYPIPDINSTLGSLEAAKFFTAINLTLGFHQVLMEVADIGIGIFEIFQRMVDDFLNEYIGKICNEYIDDIIVFGKDEAEHLRNMDTIFGRLSEAYFLIIFEKNEVHEK